MEKIDFTYEEAIAIEFVPYKIAMGLKEIGFDEPCFGMYLDALKRDTNELVTWVALDRVKKQDSFSGQKCSAPLIQQGLKWFRDKHNLNGLISFKPNIKKWDFIVYDMSLNGMQYVKNYKKYYQEHPDRKFDTYEQAQLECLKEMIEMVKNK